VVDAAGVVVAEVVAATAARIQLTAIKMPVLQRPA
jgi:hypothetical protein